MNKHTRAPAGLAGFLRIVVVWMLALCWAPAGAQDLAEEGDHGVRCGGRGEK